MSDMTSFDWVLVAVFFVAFTLVAQFIYKRIKAKREEGKLK